MADVAVATDGPMEVTVRQPEEEDDQQEEQQQVEPEREPEHELEREPEGVQAGELTAAPATEEEQDEEEEEDDDNEDDDEDDDDDEQSLRPAAPVVAVDRSPSPIRLAETDVSPRTPTEEERKEIDANKSRIRAQVRGDASFASVMPPAVASTGIIAERPPTGRGTRESRLGGPANDNVVADSVDVRLEYCKHWATVTPEPPNARVSVRRFSVAANEHRWECFGIHCGRSERGHAEQHFVRQESHVWCMNLSSLVIWCYECDEEVVAPRNLAPEDKDSSAASLASLIAGLRSVLRPSLSDDAGKADESTGANGTTPLPEAGKSAAGLNNLGNTCFFNSVVQALNCVTAFSVYFSELTPVSHRETHCNTRLAQHMASLTQALSSGRSRVISPAALHHDLCTLCPMFGGYAQHDAHEAVRYLLNGLHEQLHLPVNPRLEPGRTHAADGETTVTVKELHSISKEETEVPDCPESLESDTSAHMDSPASGFGPAAAPASATVRAGAPDARHSGSKPRPYEQSIVSDLFRGLLRSRVKCSNCKQVSVQIDEFFDLSLGIPAKAVANASSGWLASIGRAVTRMISGEAVHLEDCLWAFCSQETLSGANKYQCDKCKALHNATRQFDIHKLPEVLCIHLKRFKYDSQWGRKVSTSVEFPLRGLNLAQFVHSEAPFNNSSAVYDLASMVRHYGSLNGGHYVGFGYHRGSKNWLRFDDDRVSTASEAEVAGEQAYILFYQRRVEHLYGAVLQKASTVLTDMKSAKPSVYVSRYWWLKANMHACPGPPTAAELLCCHGQLRPCLASRVGDLVIPLSAEAWKVLAQAFGPQSECLSSLEACAECATEARTWVTMRQEQRNQVSKLDAVTVEAAIEDQPDPAHPWFLLSNVWLRAWKRFIYNDMRTLKDDGTLRGVPPPGPIDNSDLVKADGSLVAGKVRGTHYCGLNYLTWSYLLEQYGGGPIVRRANFDLYDKS